MKKKSISFLCLSLFSHFLYSRRELDLEHVFHVWSEGLEADGVQRDVVFLFCFPVFVWGEGKNKRRSNTMLTTRKLTRKQRAFLFTVPSSRWTISFGWFFISISSSEQSLFAPSSSCLYFLSSLFLLFVTLAAWQKISKGKVSETGGIITSVFAAKRKTLF